MARQALQPPSGGGWQALGALEVVGAVFLIVPAALTWNPILTPIAAAVLSLETLAIAGRYAMKSVKFTAANPFAWALVLALLIAFVAFGRFVLAPLE